MPPAGWYPDPYGAAGARWWDGQSWTGHVTDPAPGVGQQQQSRTLARFSAGALAAWCGMGVILGTFEFAAATINVHGLASERTWRNPVSPGAWIFVSSLWFLSFNLMLPGLVVGVVSIARHGRHRIARAVALVLVVAGGCVAQLATLGATSDTADVADFVRGGRLASLLFAAEAALIAVASAWALGLFRRRLR